MTSTQVHQVHAPIPFSVGSSSPLPYQRPGESALKRATAAQEASRQANEHGVSSEERSWYKGFLGEDIVGGQLGRLNEGTWCVFHDIQIGAFGRNLDHLVIGPGGVFALNTKNLKGSVWVANRAILVNGQRQDYLDKARAEAALVSRRLRVTCGVGTWVSPVIVVIADRLTVRSHPQGVSVVAMLDIFRWIESQPAQLTDQEIRLLGATAGSPTTWS